MTLLEGKTAIIFGLANDRSIAWGIAKALHVQGATLGFSYANEQLERRVRPLAESLGSTFTEECDVAKDKDIQAVADKAADTFGKVDILIHSVAFADRNELIGPYYNTSRAGFHLAMDISVYSFVGIAKAFQPILNPGGALLCMTYYGSEKVAPNYNAMGVAKAALEASTRYLAYDFGEQRIRVNAISAGPIRTLASSGVGKFRDMYKYFADAAPIKENVTIEDIGQSAVFLCSDMSRHITGEVLFVDSGYNIVGMLEPCMPADRE
ncbi:MAG: enoyl-ACP reductase [Anaerolineales bacterium]|nr:enoyl-ACP reductase [Anaerolineales bacterium]